MQLSIKKVVGNNRFREKNEFSIDLKGNQKIKVLIEIDLEEGNLHAAFSDNSFWIETPKNFPQNGFAIKKCSTWSTAEEKISQQKKDFDSNWR